MIIREAARQRYIGLDIFRVIRILPIYYIRDNICLEVEV